MIQLWLNLSQNGLVHFHLRTRFGSFFYVWSFPRKKFRQRKRHGNRRAKCAPPTWDDYDLSAFRTKKWVVEVWRGGILNQKSGWVDLKVWGFEGWIRKFWGFDFGFFGLMLDDLIENHGNDHNFQMIHFFFDSISCIYVFLYLKTKPLLLSDVLSPNSDHSGSGSLLCLFK